MKNQTSNHQTSKDFLKNNIYPAKVYRGNVKVVVKANVLKALSLKEQEVKDNIFHIIKSERQQAKQELWDDLVKNECLMLCDEVSCSELHTCKLKKRHNLQ